MGRANVSVVLDPSLAVVEVFLDPNKAQARADWLNENVGAGYTVVPAPLSDPDNLG